MTKGLFALVLMLLGAVLFYFGSERKESVAGTAQTLGYDVATAVDGKTRINDHTLYFAAGGTLIVVAMIVALRRSA